MKLLDLKPGAKCFYENHIYVVKSIAQLAYINEERDMYVPSEDCVIYERLDDPSDANAKGPFVRRVTDFVSKFQLVNIDNPALLFNHAMGNYKITSAG